MGEDDVPESASDEFYSQMLPERIFETSKNQILTKDRSDEEDNEIGADGENNGRWSTGEHNRFRNALIKYGRKWSKVAQFVGTRTDAQARSHAQKYLRKLKKHGVQQNEKEFEILKARTHVRLPKVI
jgi:SHAQKYF class myb-like DNA-binding protein